MKVLIQSRSGRTLARLDLPSGERFVVRFSIERCTDGPETVLTVKDLKLEFQKFGE